MNQKIFISYRREDSGGVAGRLYESLRTKYGKNKLFKDVYDIPYGSNFREEIRQAIDKSGIVLVIIGKHFSTEEKRLFDKDDHVRFEILYALKSGKLVIPVLVNGATIPTSNSIPAEIKRILYLHAAELRNTKWQLDIEDFIKHIDKHSQEPGTQTTPNTRGLKFITKVLSLTLGVLSFLTGLSAIFFLSFQDAPWDDNLLLPLIVISLAGISGGMMSLFSETTFYGAIILSVSSIIILVNRELIEDTTMSPSFLIGFFSVSLLTVFLGRKNAISIRQIPTFLSSLFNKRRNVDIKGNN